MAIPTGTGVTYTWGMAAGSANREDLLDMVALITPWETPFFSAAPKTRASHVTHEWIEDSLASADASGRIEGDAFSGATLSARTRATNQTQIFRKDIEVSNTQQAVNPAGVRNEYQYQIQKALKELARNIETRIFSTVAATTGASDGGRLMKSLDNFITTNYAGPATGTASATATSGAFTSTGAELIFNNVLEQIYTAGGAPESAYVSPGIKRDISAFSTVNTRNIAADDKRLVASVDVYDSDFGLIQIVMDRFVPQVLAIATSTLTASLTGRLFFVERAKARIAFLRPMRHIPVAPAADSTRGMVLTELTLELLNQDAHGKIMSIYT